MTNRNVFKVVEIDVDQCARTYGSAPCTASLSAATPDKCFNTFKTCQDTANYSAATPLTLRFVENVGGLGKGSTVFPFLRSVSTSAAQLNVAGADDYYGPLGQRERVTIVLDDGRYQDTLTDPYQAERVSGAAQNSGVGYNPLDQGWFWGKFLARNFWKGRPIRVKYGEPADAYSAMETRHYIIDNISGPSGANRTVTIEALGVITVADDKKALCPAPSAGTIAEDITETTTRVLLQPEGIISEYPVSGTIRIGEELMTYGRESFFGTTDYITIVRGRFGTTATSHEKGATAQLCYRVQEELPSAVIAELLTDYASVPSSYIDSIAWQNEVTTWYPGLTFNTIITEPTPVSELLSEIGQLGIYLWEDTRNQSIELRTNRYVDVDETVTEINDDANVLERSMSVERRERALLTRVVINYDPVDFVRPDRYSFQTIAIDVEAEGANANDMERTRIINTRWLSELRGASVSSIALRILGRYNEIPEYYTFDIDEKDLSNLMLADYFELTTDKIQDATGATNPVQCQVIGVEEVMPGHRARVRAQKVVFRIKLGFYMTAGASDYGSASTAEKRDGAYWAGSDEKVGSDAAYRWG